MGWTQRSIGLVLLAVLTDLPVSGTVCAFLCDPGANPASGHAANAHNASAANCHESASPEQPEWVSAVARDCGRHDGGPRQAVESMPAGRADVKVVSVREDVAPAAPAPLSLTSRHTYWNDSPLSGTASSVSIPLVLRI